MTKTTPQAQSSLHISQSVVETIVTETIREIDGVYALAALQEKGAPDCAMCASRSSSL